MEVILLEREDRILKRVTAPEMSAFFQELHKAKGVDILTKKNVTAIKTTDQHNEVVCADGTSYQADMIVVGVGIRVNKELAEQYQREDVKAVMDAGNIDEATANERVEAFYDRASKEVQEASKAVTDFLSGRGIVVQPDRTAEEVDKLADEIKDMKKSQSRDRNGGFDR